MKIYLVNPKEERIKQQFLMVQEPCGFRDNAKVNISIFGAKHEKLQARWHVISSISTFYVS